MKKYASNAAQINTSTLFWAMHDYFQARRKGDQAVMDEQLRLAEACIQSLEEDADYIEQMLLEMGGVVVEEVNDEEDQPLLNIPKWYN